MRGKRSSRTKLSFVILLLCGIVLLIAGWLGRQNIAVLEPAGTIGHKERNLIYLAVGLCAIVVIPVFALTIGIVLKYREGAKKPGKYRPDWNGSRALESTWWGVPFIIITILAVVTWISSYNLDPYKALASTNKPVNIQVVALDWKWLFIYPNQNIASVNFLEVPTNTPINFYITSDTVMNSFWIPNLGGQIYAMPGMVTQLHLMVSKAGNYPGSSANISGRGFADMHFTATASDQASFDTWVSLVKTSANQLTPQTYSKLSKPGKSSAIDYGRIQSGVFDAVVSKYMAPPGLGSQMEGVHG